ncbi:MAG: hypothetical protein ACKO9Z_12615 [Planctomycetota bacterium]
MSSLQELITGAAGAAVSIVNTNADEATDWLPATSVAVARNE